MRSAPGCFCRASSSRRARVRARRRVFARPALLAMLASAARRSAGATRGTRRRRRSRGGRSRSPSDVAQREFEIDVRPQRSDRSVDGLGVGWLFHAGRSPIGQVGAAGYRPGRGRLAGDAVDVGLPGEAGAAAAAPDAAAESGRQAVPDPGAAASRAAGRSTGRRCARWWCSARPSSRSRGLSPSRRGRGGGWVPRWRGRSRGGGCPGCRAGRRAARS